MHYFSSKSTLFAKYTIQDLEAGLRIFSEDVSDGNGSKRFFVLDDPTRLAEVVRNSRHIYEVIPDVENHPCYLFFDIDSPIANVEPSAFLDNFKLELESFLLQRTGSVINLVIGQTLQAKHTPYPIKVSNKLSIHVKVNLLCPSVRIMKTIVKDFVKYLHQNAQSTPVDMFFYIDGKGDRTCVIDYRVYSNFRSFRTLYSSKRTTSIETRPLGDSSVQIVDHLVMWHQHISQICVEIDISKFYTAADVLSAPPSQPRKETSSPLHHHDFNATIRKLETSPTLLEAFDTPQIKFHKNIQQHPTFGKSICYFLDKRTKVKCPYAKRIHKSNRTFVVHDTESQTIIIKCFDEDCIGRPQHVCFLFDLVQEPDTDRLILKQSVKSLHSLQTKLHWNEIYNAPKMRPYPMRSMVCVRANMGACKTEELLNFIRLRPSSESFLIITYQVLLADAYASKLKDHGFSNYSADAGGRLCLDQDRLVICLDSLWKVKPRTFDFIVIDEVLSVLLHFNSSVMKRSAAVSAMFELLLLRAKHVYFVDACVDHSIVQDVVAYLASKRNCENTYAIWNQHIRPSNRRCNMFIHRNMNRQSHVQLQQCVCERVTEAINRGEKVVVASTTKSFTNMLVDVLKLHTTTVKYVLHNGDQARQLDPTSSWGQADVLVYSPSIGAGVSFTEPHFDVLFAYIENSFYTPTVDFVLQQLFRVRQLKKGDMYLYVNDGFLTEEAKGRYPTQQTEIEAWMDANVMTLPDQYCPTSVTYKSEPTIDYVRQLLVYDKDKLSYKILRGIVTMKNTSLVYFQEILQNTLQEDYNIPCNVQECPSLCPRKPPTHSMTQPRKQCVIDPEDFDSSMVISKSEYHKLSRILCHQKSDVEKHLMWIHEAVVCLWRIESRYVDRWFYEHCIGQHDREIKKAKELFAKCLRWHIAATNHNMESIIKMIEIEMKSIDGDYNMTLFHKNPAMFYQMILEGKNAIQNVFGPLSISALVTEGSITVNSDDFVPNLRVFVASLSEARFGQLRSLMSMDKRAYPSLAKMRSNKINQQAFIGKLLDVSFGIRFKLVKRTTKTQLWRVDNGMFRDIVERYKPTAFVL